MTSLEIQLFGTECADCILPEGTMAIQYVEDEPKVADTYSDDLLDAFKSKASLAHKDINVGSSNYADYSIQPWDIWRVYNLDPWRADIIKRILRTKAIPTKSMTESKLEDLHKIKHICDELIAQLNGEYLD